MAKKSHLHEYHKRNGKMTEFGGFEMPIWYRGIIEEHSAVRNSVGLFDVSHMGRMLIRGQSATNFLDSMLPNHVRIVKAGKAFYSTICNDSGGIMDDVIVNKMTEDNYLMVVNAANRDKDYTWLAGHHQNASGQFLDISDDSALFALQGPMAEKTLGSITDLNLELLKRFSACYCTVLGKKCLVSRTGYTGEDGFEIMVTDSPVNDPVDATMIWDKLVETATPCGLGARDLLRLEAGMCLYGQDIDESTTPVEAALNVVNPKKEENYPGKGILLKQLSEGTERKRIAFSMESEGIPRHGNDLVIAGKKVGTVTSGSFSPILKKGIGMGYVSSSLSGIGTAFSISIRNNLRPARVAKTPFYDTNRYGYSRQEK